MVRKSDIDSGWAWVVVTSSYLAMFLFCIGMYMNGVIYVALLEKFKEGEAKTALIGAIGIGLQCFVPLIGGVVNNKFSCRVSIVLGGVLTSLGLAVSAFVNNLDLLIVTSGVCVGIGNGFAASGLICVAGFYFEKWRNVVLSLAFLAVGAAMLVSSPLGLLLLNTQGLAATYLILACIEAHLCVLGVLCKPSSVEMSVQVQRNLDKQRNTKSALQNLFDYTLLQNKSYFLFLMSTSTWTFALSSAIMHLPNYITVLGGTSHDVGLVMMSFSVANMLGRLSGAVTVSKLSDKSLYVHVTVLASTGIITSLFIMYSKWTEGAYMFAIQLGICTGWPNAMMTPISLSFVGVKKLSEAYGLACSFCGIGVTFGPVVTGYIYSVSKSYEYSFVVAGAILIAGSFFGVGSLCCRVPMKEVSKDIVIAADECTHVASTDEEYKIINIMSDTKQPQVDNKNDLLEDSERETLLTEKVLDTLK